MTKELFFDLEFTTEGKVKPISQAGTRFLTLHAGLLTRKQIYQTALDRDLHVRFASVHLRDLLSAPDLQCNCR